MGKGGIKITKPINVPPKRSVKTVLDPRTLHWNIPATSKATMSRKWEYAGDVPSEPALRSTGNWSAKTSSVAEEGGFQVCNEDEPRSIGYRGALPPSNEDGGTKKAGATKVKTKPRPWREKSARTESVIALRKRPQVSRYQVANEIRSLRHGTDRRHLTSTDANWH